MKVYDESIKKTLALLGKSQARLLPLTEGYPLDEGKVFLFPEDAAIDLGGREKPSPYEIAYTSSVDLVKDDACYLIGKDIPELDGETSFAHVSLLRFEEEEGTKEQTLYRYLRDIEYTRYKLNPFSVMIRVNTNRIREGALIGKEAVDKGLNFSKLGALFADAYKKETRVKAVVQYFITDPAFPYAELETLAKQNEGITVALDHIMKKLAMDCSTCQFKGVCDEIEGIRDVHRKEVKF